MPKVLTLTPSEGESTEEFAARVAAKVPEFFGGSAEPGTETSSEPATDETTEPTPTEEETTASLTDLFNEFGRGPGWVTNPEATRRLHAYWTKGKGAAKIRWGQPGDFDRCRKQVGEEIGESDPGKLRFINQICAQWHKDATGATPGHAPAEGG